MPQNQSAKITPTTGDPSPGAAAVAGMIFLTIAVAATLSYLIPTPSPVSGGPTTGSAPGHAWPDPAPPALEDDMAVLREQLSSGVSSLLREAANRSGVPDELIGRDPYVAQPLPEPRRNRTPTPRADSRPGE